jgi:GNAT superfamily N-acetyltransferase
MQIRPMRPGDVDAAERITARAFAPAEPGTQASPDNAAHSRSPQARQRWTDRLRHFLTTDPDGSWVADVDGEVSGIAVSVKRDLMWVLSSYAVDPACQSRGVGKALLEAALSYGEGCLRGMLCALPHAQALRRYRQAGFSLYPAMRLVGTVSSASRTDFPDVRGVRAGTEADLELVDSVDRRVRGATHRPDHPILAGYGPLLVSDLMTGSGYVYLDRSGIGLLAATNKTIAQRLLWSALMQIPSDEEIVVRYLTSDQEWALDVGLTAGLRIEPDGFLAFRHMRPPTPYIPSVPFG